MSPGTLAAWLPQVTLLSRIHHTPYPTALPSSCPIPRGLGARQPLAIGTRCRSVLQPPGPCAPQSRNLRGRVPPNPATSGAVCPQFLLSPGLSHHLHAPPHPPVVVPGASVPLPCLRAPPVPPLFTIVGHPPPAHPVL